MSIFKIRMKQSSNIYSGNQSHTKYTINISKTFIGKEHKYQKFRDISSTTIFPNTDPDIDSPHCKGVCHC